MQGRRGKHLVWSYRLRLDDTCPHYFAPFESYLLSPMSNPCYIVVFFWRVLQVCKKEGTNTWFISLNAGIRCVVSAPCFAAEACFS